MRENRAFTPQRAETYRMILHIDAHCLKQRASALQVIVAHRDMQRRTAQHVNRRHVRLTTQQPLRRLHASVFGRVVQRRRLHGVHSVDVRTGRHQHAQHIQVTAGRSQMHRRGQVSSNVSRIVHKRRPAYDDVVHATRVAALDRRPKMRCRCVEQAERRSWRAADARAAVIVRRGGHLSSCRRCRRVTR